MAMSNDRIISADSGPFYRFVDDCSRLPDKLPNLKGARGKKRRPPARRKKRRGDKSDG